MAQLGEDGGSPDEAPVQITRRRSRVQKGEGLWLMSFSDMSLILMSFFVLQLSYSTPDKHKYDNLNSAIQEQTAKPLTAADAAALKGAQNLRTLSAKLRELIKEKKLSDTAEVSSDMNGLAIEFKDKLLFEPGSADLSPSAKAQVGTVLATIAAAPGNYQLVFEGHTDDVPTTGGKFRSNWELSSARGIALLNGFKARGVVESRMGVRAYAQTRPKVPVVGLSGEALRKARAANRRVVIRLE